MNKYYPHESTIEILLSGCFLGFVLFFGFCFVFCFVLGFLEVKKNKFREAQQLVLGQPAI